MIALLLGIAHAQTVTGGFGVGLFAGYAAIQRFGYTGVASVEVAQLAEEVPWLGVGAETVVGFQPKYCTQCDVAGTFRVGAGPLFRQRSGFVQVGARYSVFGARRGIRPFALTKGRLPVSRGEIRPLLWVEGLRATEIGLGLEVGFALKGEKIVVFPGDPDKPAETTEPEPPADPEPSPDPETPAEPAP